MDVSTEISTTTVTESDQDTATSTVFETVTTPAPARKRAAGVAKRTGGPAQVAAVATADVPLPTEVLNDSWELAKRHLIKRETFTETTTITVDGDDAETTVVDTISRETTVRVTEESTTTSVVTVTEQVGASTTTTVTSTLTVEGPPEEPTDGGDNDGNSDEDGSSSGDDDGGLSTGAQIGIGVGVGVAGLLAIAGLIFFCMRRRRRGPKVDSDDLIGASEVPVGPSVPAVGSPGVSHAPSTSQHSATAAAFLAPHRTGPSTKSSPEGYRGTALGDGRAGYAKPAPYGAAYTQPTARSNTYRSGGDHLPEHPVPGEMDHNGVSPAQTPSPRPVPAEMGYSDGGAARWHSAGAAEIDGLATSPVSTRPATGSPPPAIINQPPPPPQPQPQEPVYEMSAQSYH